MSSTDILIFSIFLSSSISFSSQSNLSYAVWSISHIFEQSQTNSANRPKMQRRTKSLTFPSSYLFEPFVYWKSTDMQYAPISKKTAESARRTSLNRMTLHFDHLTWSIMTLKFPTKKMISRGKATIVIIWYQQPQQMTRRKPTKPKELATWARKILSKRIQRLKIFHLSLHSRYVEINEKHMVDRVMHIDIQAFDCSS